MHPSLRVLEEVIKQHDTSDEGDGSGKKRRRRLIELLRPADGKPCGWFFYVPDQFNPALNIVQTPGAEGQLVWTQGGIFSFANGDILYDTPSGYQSWAEALENLHYCIQVKSATPVAAPKTKESKRFPGSVEFEVFAINNARTNIEPSGTYRTTQDGFVRLLISGMCPELKLQKTREVALLV